MLHHLHLTLVDAVVVAVVLPIGLALAAGPELVASLVDLKVDLHRPENINIQSGTRSIR